MPTLGSFVFDPHTTAVSEQWEEIGGRDTRIIRLKGLLESTDREALEARLDALLAAASEESYAPLSLRASRRMWVRRNAFRRELSSDGRTATFSLDLETREPGEEAIEASTGVWPILASESAATVHNDGTAPAPLSVELLAQSPLIAPTFSMGSAYLRYDGVVAPGATLYLDAVAQRASLGELDITPYVQGAFLLVLPGENVVLYTDDEASGHLAQATLMFRARWW